MKVYLINLDRHPDRLAHMRVQLDASGSSASRRSTDRTSRRPRRALRASSWRASIATRSVAPVLEGPASHACFLEDDLHIWPGFAALIGREAWIPADAHSVKLDTYLQAVELGDRRVALDGRSSLGLP